MKRQYVSSLQEGDQVNDYFLAARKDLREQTNGNKFLGMVFKDKTGEVGAILWTNAASVARLFEVGDVVNVRGVVSSYQDRLQIRVDQVLPLREGDYSTDDLVAVPEDQTAVLGEYRAILDAITDPWLIKLAARFLGNTAFMERFTEASAGKKWHHAHPGGLLRHCYEMSRIALTLCELYPNINRDLLLMGVFLHDIGKLDEMSHELLVDYTSAGKLLGHLEIGSTWVQREIDAIEGFPEDLRLHIVHCILSHHGELANGSPIVPKTLEAIVLYHCDNLDAQTDAITRIVRETREKRLEWSEFIPLIDRQIWTK